MQSKSRTYCAQCPVLSSSPAKLRTNSNLNIFLNKAFTGLFQNSCLSCHTKVITGCSDHTYGKETQKKKRSKPGILRTEQRVLGLFYVNPLGSVRGEASVCENGWWFIQNSHLCERQPQLSVDGGSDVLRNIEGCVVNSLFPLTFLIMATTNQTTLVESATVNKTLEPAIVLTSVWSISRLIAPKCSNSVKQTQWLTYWYWIAQEVNDLFPARGPVVSSHWGQLLLQIIGQIPLH